MLQLPARVLAGGLLGFAIWGSLAPLYHPAITSVSNALIRTVEGAGATHLIWRNGEVIVDRADFSPGSSRPSIALGDLTSNLILLTVLFALPAAPLKDRNVGRYAAAACTLVPLHVLALVAAVESIYALQLGSWSMIHYGAFARNVWATAAHFYSVVGIHAAPIVLWLLYTPASLLPERLAIAGRPRSARRAK